ncbi:FAD-binding oxidoreductase [Geodermatophilus amargosae]|nr:FAD-binding oxidoreductase [Geodermatophilus amargosae]
MANLVLASGEVDVRLAVRDAGTRGVLARGLGRSYGDSAQNGGGTVVDMSGLARILSVDTTTGHVVTEAGVSLDTLVRVLLPLGLLVPVLPGTRQVTVGGAIAADIHGKNHHVKGSFGNHVAAMDLLLADGSVRTLTPQGAPELFWATVGGMGLTGIILRATVVATPVDSAYFVVDTERTRDLDDLMARLQADDDEYDYSVAWIDLVARGAAMGRSVLTRGWSARADQLPQRLRGQPYHFASRSLFTAPNIFPSGLLNKVTIAAFNEAYYRKTPREQRGAIQSIGQFFHPLDVAKHWNRIYGQRGFLQYQFVVPFGAEDAMRRAVERLSTAGAASFLAVLKRFGPGNPGLLSFPTPGWTLALDIPVAPGLGRLLDELDDLVLSAGGRLYLAKDSRAQAETLHQMYPRIDEWRTVRDQVDPAQVFSSDQARRLFL